MVYLRVRSIATVLVFGISVFSVMAFQVSGGVELSPPVAGGEAGSAVVFGSGWLAVGAPLSNVGVSTNQGVTHIYNVQDSGSWLYATSLVASAGAEYDYFGRVLAADSNTLAIGVASDDQAGVDAGAVYIFTTDGTNWIQRQKLMARDPGAGYLFGCSVSLDGSRLAVGSRKESVSGSKAAGAVFVFERGAGGVWTQSWRGVSTVAAAYDYFGCAVSIDGDELLVGADNSDPHGSKSGSARIFIRDYSHGTSWTQKRVLTADDGAAFDMLGSSVALCDGIAAVGAPNAGESGSGVGAVYIFGRNDGGSNHWGQVKKLLPLPISITAAFGSSVAINAELLVVGAPEAVVNGVAAAGTVLTFDVPAENEEWGTPLRIIPAPPVEGEHAGASVALEDSELSFGVPGCENAGVNAGAVRLYAVDTEKTIIMHAPVFKNKNVHISWIGGTNLMQILESRVALDNGVWHPVFTNGPPAMATGSYQEPAGEKRFYRVRAVRP